MNICVVFVCNKNYLQKFSNTLHLLRINGQYNGEVVLIIGDDLKEQETELKNKYNIKVKYFPDIIFDKEFINNFNSLNRSAHWKIKKFQYHKFYLFDVYFKQWDFIFYLDCGINIFRPIQPILDSKKKNKLLAHNDAYPTYIWKLSNQFDNNHHLFKKLEKEYNLNINYFQTTIMLYDTKIINENTYYDLFKLANKYPISRTNDQGIIALFYTTINKKWEQIKMQDDTQYYYDYMKRNNNKPYIMHKI